jgi:MscS family membrane protein
MRMFAKLFLAILLVLPVPHALPQGLSSVLGASNAAPVPAPAPTDPYGRNTPRSSMYNFLEACHSEQFTKSWHFLDLRKWSADDREKEGAALAQNLASLLDHSSQFDLTNLSDSPDGKRTDGLAADTDELATFQLEGQPVTLHLQRIDRNGLKIWLVSADSLDKISNLKLLSGESAIEKALPTPFIRIKLLGTSLWVWIALVLLGVVLLFLSKLFSRAALALLRPVAKKYAGDLNAVRLEAFAEPVRLLLAIAVFRACIEAFTPSALLRLYIGYLLTLLFFLGLASLTMRIVDMVSDHVRTRLDTRQRAMSYSILPLFVRMIKICIFSLAIMATLAEWGYNTNAILAGLGVGGLAIALAAQKTIENLFGSIAVITDRPVLVGDFFNYGGNVGTVEDIGLRSTRIRTLDRTVVTIPNSVFSTMTL